VAQFGFRTAGAKTLAFSVVYNYQINSIFTMAVDGANGERYSETSRLPDISMKHNLVLTLMN
jgi:hypothetical protein